eukprot:2667117-Rhodomonas_salina.1
MERMNWPRGTGYVGGIDVGPLDTTPPVERYKIDPQTLTCIGKERLTYNKNTLQSEWRPVKTEKKGQYMGHNESQWPTTQSQ